MYDHEQDALCQVRQMSLLDELGQVTHIFSDKTGTLTSNHMEFRRCIIDGIPYGVGDTAISRAVSGEAGGTVVPRRSRPTPAFACCKPSTATYVNYEESEQGVSLLDELPGRDEGAARRREFMVNLAVNHSVLLEMVNGREELCASSPDEQAFVAGAEFFGFELVQRNSEKATLTIRDKISGAMHIVELLVAFPYESSRKRMSVLVRLPPALVESCGGGSAVRLYSKGADSVMLSVLAANSRGSDGPSVTELQKLLCDWADIALRTLVFCKREVDHFDEWYARWAVASNSVEQIRKHKLGEPNAISQLQAELESQMELQGATAIEDKLQDGVPEVLADLRTAGIKVWMLTGDKIGTAKNIATACNILPRAGARVLELTTESHPVLNELKTSELLKAQLVMAAVEAERDAAAQADWGRATHRRQAAEAAHEEELLNQIKRFDREHAELVSVRSDLEKQWAAMATVQASGAMHSTGTGGTTFCMVLDEKAIEYCGVLCKSLLAAVGSGCHSVVACRARKDQKAQLLNLVKENVKKSCCLAIGDGANDVAMIKAGHIGVGIIGKEGMQAVNNSDFAIGQFRFLRQLLLVHGRMSYQRMSIFCYYMFYKNIANVLAMYLYTVFFALASGERLYLAIYIELYNIVYTSIPIIM